MSFWNRKLDPADRLAGLLIVPRPKRDERWSREFLVLIVDASLTFTSEVGPGPDGLPYVVAQRAASGASNVSTLRREVEGLTDAGFGVALEPQGEVAAWVFSLGSLAGFRMFGDFDEPLGWSSPTRVRGAHETEVLQEEESAQVGAPNEEYLPLFLRPHLGQFLQGSGIPEPHVALVLRQNGAQRLLAFGTEDDAICRYLSWYLPPGYGVIGLDPTVVRECGVPLLPSGPE